MRVETNRTSNLAEAHRLLGTIIVDAIVFDAHPDELKERSPAFDAVVESHISATIIDGDRP